MKTTRLRIDADTTYRWTGKLTREDGSKVPLTDLTAASITMVDVSSGEPVNARTAQDIRGSGSGDHDFQFQETTDADGKDITEIGWDIQRNDTKLLSSSERTEEHLARLTWEYTVAGHGTKHGAHDLRLRCVGGPGLLLYEDVADFLKGLEEDEAAKRLRIEEMIDGLTLRLEAETQRTLWRSTEAAPSTEIHTVQANQNIIWLNRWPVQKIVSIKQDVGGKFDTVQAENLDDFYVDYQWGTIENRFANFVPGYGTVQVKTAAGVYRDPFEVPADLREAALQQIVFWWQRRGQLGLSSVSVGGQSVQIYATLDLLPQVKRLLHSPRWRRVQL